MRFAPTNISMAGATDSFKGQKVYFMSFKLSDLVLPFTLFLAACSASGQPSDLPLQPPMWVVSDADSEITLYPTLHILPADIDWKSEELFRRLASADEVWFEIMPGSENDPTLQQTMFELGMVPGSSLTESLSPPEVAALEKAVEVLGMPMESVDIMRPWLASTLVSMSALISKGFDPEAGVETQLHPIVKGKEIRALETAKSQIQMLASLPEQVQFTMLRETLEDLDQSVEDLKSIVEDWSVGDVEDLEDELLDEMKSDMPDVYKAIFTNRNRNWVDQIEDELKGSGTDFIAVGAGHLVGDDGVPALLKARGYSVNRL